LTETVDIFNFLTQLVEALNSAMDCLLPEQSLSKKRPLAGFNALFFDPNTHPIQFCFEMVRRNLFFSNQNP
jgi:hypothetical protein